MSGACPRHARYQQDDPNQGHGHTHSSAGWMAREARGASGSCRKQWRGEEGKTGAQRGVGWRALAKALR